MSDKPAALDVTSPFDNHLGVRVTELSADKVVAQLEVGEHLLQPAGIVHGGVYATLVETVASMGAWMWLQASQKEGGEMLVPVGVSNHTDFLRSVRSGVLRAESAPLQRGETMQLWQVDITDEKGRRVAHGRVRLMNIKPR